MLATLVVGATLALGRLAPSPDGKTLWPVWGVAFVGASVISSIAMLPAGALLLRMQPFRRGLWWSVLYAAAWIALEWILATILWSQGVPLPPRPIFVGLASLMFTFAATLILTATLARSRGYRLTSAPCREATSRR
jgi:carbon starvation protein CstA